MNNNKLFVYGTLKQGHRNHRVMPKEARLLGEARVEGRMVSLGGFPGVIKDSEGISCGELWDIPTDKWKGLDALEGNGSFYTREIVPITMDCGTIIQGWVYFLPEEQWGDSPTIEDGVW